MRASYLTAVVLPGSCSKWTLSLHDGVAQPTPSLRVSLPESSPKTERLCVLKKRKPNLSFGLQKVTLKLKEK